jgi:hypothetical protein
MPLSSLPFRIRKAADKERGWSQPSRPAGEIGQVLFGERAAATDGRAGGRTDGIAASGTPLLRPGGTITTTPERGDVADCALPLQTGPSVVILSLSLEREKRLKIVW